MRSTIPDVLIIGAGLAGLKIAGDLHAAGRTALVLDKGRGVGGRAATRRWDGVPVDHGAQFFTVREPDFQAMTDRWLAQETCFEWAQGFHQWDDDGRGLRPPAPDDGHTRYACRAGMSALCKELAGGLPRETVRLQSKVAGVRWERDHWRAEVEGDSPGEVALAGRRLVLALPVPQALALLGPLETLETHPLISGAAWRSLREVETAPALAVLLRGPAPAPGWQGIQLRDATLSWISDDSSKRLPAAVGADRIFVLHGSGEFSRQWQDADLDEAARRLTARAGEIVGDWITRLPGRQIHRWRYASVPHTLEKAGFLRATGALGAPLYFAGDGFLKGKIEGACRSGLLLARELREELEKAAG